MVVFTSADSGSVFFYKKILLVKRKNSFNNIIPILTTIGTIGGDISRRSKATQSTERKNLCRLIASVFFDFEPRRALGFLRNNWKRNLISNLTVKCKLYL